MKRYFYTLGISQQHIRNPWIYGSLIVFLFGIALARIIPPLQSPDEDSHLMRAYAISQGQWSLVSAPNQSSGSQVDIGLLEFIEGNLHNLRTPGWRPSVQAQSRLREITWQGATNFVSSPGTGYYNPLIYLPQAIGLWLGQSFDWTIAHTYQLCRLLSTLLVLSIIGLAFQTYMPNPLAIGLLILPMSLFQILMPTIDGICHALTLLILCWFVRLQQESAKKDLPIAFAVLLVLLITCRLYALPLLLLILAINLPQSKPTLRQWLLFALSLFIVGIWSLWAQTHITDLRVSQTLSTLLILQYYLQHPSVWLEVFFNTLGSEEIWGFYGKSFIGLLGWLHIGLPAWCYPLGGTFLVCMGLLSLRPMRLNASNNLVNRLVFFIPALLSIALIFNLILFTWTPFPNKIIEGVQGRYFWIPACTFAFGLGLSKPMTSLTKMLLGAALIFNFVIIYFSYLNAYY